MFTNGMPLMEVSQSFVVYRKSINDHPGELNFIVGNAERKEGEMGFPQAMEDAIFHTFRSIPDLQGTMLQHLMSVEKCANWELVRV